MTRQSLENTNERGSQALSADSGRSLMQKEVEMSSKVLQMSLSCCFGTSVPVVGKEGGKSFSSISEFCLNSLVLLRCCATVPQPCIYNYTMSLSNTNEPIREKFFVLWEPMPPLSYFV